MADEDEDGGGFDAEDWTRLKPFVGAVATLDDVQARRAVFALGAVLKVRRASDTAETIVAPEPGLLDDPAEDRMAAMDDDAPRSR